jgi:Zn-dependent protease with chaperone function
MTSLLLVLLSVVLVAAIPGRLVHAGWVYRSPRVGVLAWQTTMLTLLVSMAGAALTLVMPWHPAHEAMCGAWRLCFDTLGGAHGGVMLVVAWTGVTVLAVGLVRIVLAVVPIVRVARRRRGHAAAARLVGHHRPDLQATVVECTDPAVYLVPGRRGEVVVTTGALARLGDDELDAVLAHERAHARDNHHRPLALAALLSSAFPAVRLFALAHRQIGRLVEMCADDSARREHSPLALARALTALAIPEPAGVLSGSGGDALERMRRLLYPPEPLPRPVQVVAVACLLTLPLVPLVAMFAAPVMSGLPAGSWA